jgi:flavin-dependent dehydrogenase
VARDAGARVELSTAAQRIARTNDGWQLTVENGEGRATISCRWLVDCSGRSAWVARRYGATRIAQDRLVAFVSLFSRTADDPEDLDSLTLVESAPDGWWYTSRLPAGDRVVVYLTDARDASARQARGMRGFAALVDETVHVRARLEAHRYAAPGPPRIVAAETSRLDRVVGDRWIAAGDAAMSFDPLSSQGILTAIYAGMGAAGALSSHLSGDETATTEYAARIDSVYNAYLAHRLEYYAQERRWPRRSFWRRRHRSDFRLQPY